MKRRLFGYIFILTFFYCVNALPVYAAEKSVSVVDEDTYIAPDMYDPLEGINRPIYRFNDTVDTWILKPVSDTYRTVVPSWGRDRIRSFLKNILTPVTFINSILQGDSQNAFTSFWRFTLNSTLGIGGLFDFAEVAGLKERKEDFGQTLGVYGLNNGAYLVVPFLGPSSVRDITGKVADVFMDPFNYVLSEEALVARNVVDIVNTRADKDSLIEEIKRVSLDPYATTRSLYLQNRSDAVRNGRLSVR